jgi:hypothetical protein
MDSPAGFTPDSDANAPAPEYTGEAMSNAEMRRILEDMYTRQQRMEIELERTRSVPNATHASTAPLDGRSFNDLLAALNQVVAALSHPKAEQEPAVPRDWKPPTWDG